MCSRIKRWCRNAWPWVAVVVLGVVALLGVRSARDALAKRVRRIQQAREKEARKLKHEELVANALRESAEAREGEHEARAAQQRSEVERVEADGRARRERLRRLGVDELESEASAQAERSRRRGGLLLALALLWPARAVAEDACISRADLEQLVADSFELDAMHTDILPRRAAELAETREQAAAAKDAAREARRGELAAIEQGRLDRAAASYDREARRAVERSRWQWVGIGSGVALVLGIVAGWAVAK